MEDKMELFTIVPPVHSHSTLQSLGLFPGYRCCGTPCPWSGGRSLLWGLVQDWSHLQRDRGAAATGVA